MRMTCHDDVFFNQPSSLSEVRGSTSDEGLTRAMFLTSALSGNSCCHRDDAERVAPARRVGNAVKRRLHRGRPVRTVRKMCKSSVSEAEKKVWLLKCVNTSVLIFS